MKTALVTGGVKRIGAAIAEDLARNGYNLALQYVSSVEEAEELASRLKKHGIKIALFEKDLSTTKACRSLFKFANQALGPVNLLINNASVFDTDEAIDFDDDTWDRHFALHLKAPSALAAELAKQGEIENGLVVNMIDQRVWRLNPNFYSYTLSKSALWTATQTMAQSLAPNIRVNAIGPGPTLQNERQANDDFQKQIDGLLLQRGPELEEFGRTIRFLHETRSITGQMIALDGGQHLAWETPDIAGIKE
ncbi:MAG: SDR family oxidoreductase [Pseudomonadota bacterium]